jgi:hypothetical protein
MQLNMQPCRRTKGLYILLDVKPSKNNYFLQFIQILAGLQANIHADPRAYILSNFVHF